MAMNPFDQASRYGGKLNPVGFLGWLLHEDPGTLRYQGWLDTRTLPFPGDPERICDTVACLGDETPDEFWAVPLEFNLQPDGTMFGRLLIYLGQIWLERRPAGEGTTRYHVGAIVVNLTGQGRTSRDLRLRRTGMRTCVQVVECNMMMEDAAVTLAGIAAGRVARCLLPWIPLMQGGGEADSIAMWRELALAEPDPKLRADYGGLALVFAEAAGRHALWKAALEDWNVTESQQVLEWQTQAKAAGLAEGKAAGLAEGKTAGLAEGKAEAVLQVLEARFGGVPGELAARIRSATNSEQLTSWLRLAVSTVSLADFRREAAL